MPRTVAPAGSLRRRTLRPSRPTSSWYSTSQPELVQERGEFLVGEPAAELEHDFVIEEARLVERRHAARQRTEAEGRDRAGGRTRLPPAGCAALLSAGRTAASARAGPTGAGLVVDDELRALGLGADIVIVVAPSVRLRRDLHDRRVVENAVRICGGCGLDWRNCRRSLRSPADVSRRVRHRRSPGSPGTGSGFGWPARNG